MRGAKFDSPNSRAKLSPSQKPYYLVVDDGLHLGYRKGERTTDRTRSAGKWVLRRYVGGKKYVVETIAAADDFSDANGRDLLSFFQAQERAREVAARHRISTTADDGPLTVSKALDAYFDRLDGEHSKSLSDARQRAALHIRPKLGDALVSEITRERIAKWHSGLAASPRNVRGKAGKPARPLGEADGQDEIRRRRASANRVLTILKAALNQSFRDGKVASDTAWRAVKPFGEVEAARVRYFTQDEVRRLVNAAQGSFRVLVNAALFTGARYGELGRLRIGDFNPDSGTVFIGQSKSGKSRHIVLTEEGQRFFTQITAGRATDELMLRHDDGSAWRDAHQTRPMKDACAAANIKAAGFHVLRHTSASHYVMAGVPLPVIARNLGHADTRMTEKHYAHLAPSFVAEQIRRFAPTFGTVEPTTVVPIASARM